MAQLDEIKSIIMNMKAQSRAQAQAEAPQTEGSAALAIEQPAVKVAEPMQLIRGGKFENYLNESQNAQNLRGQYGDTDPLQKQEKDTRGEASNEPVEPFKNECPSVYTCQKIKNAVKALTLGTHYGPVKGIKGNILFKAGAIKLLQLCSYHHNDQLLDKTVDAANGFIGYTVRVVIVDENGVPISEGIGSANSLEKKFADKGFSSDYLLVNMAQKRALIQAIKELLV